MKGEKRDPKVERYPEEDDGARSSEILRAYLWRSVKVSELTATRWKKNAGSPPD